jgi:hypothetical protein
MGQLARILLAGPSGSPDEQLAAPDEGGGYGELMDAIDRLIDDLDAVDVDRPDR